MDIHRIPSDKKGAEIALKSEKAALLELHQMIIENDLTKAYQVTGLINNLVEEIDEVLGDE